MKSGKCPKCNSTEIFASYGKSSLDSGMSTGDGQPLLRLRTAKSGLFGDDFKMLYLETYVCRVCGCVEQYVHDLDALGKIDACANWRRVTQV